jgi:hypothetical protein
MTPSDSCPSRGRVMSSPTASPSPRVREEQRPDRSLRFRTVLSASAVSNHPGKLATSQAFVVRRRDAGFTTSGGLTASDLRNEAESSSLSLRLTPSVPQAPRAGSPRRTLSSLHGSRTFPMVGTFQPTKAAKLGLAHRRRERFHATAHWEEGSAKDKDREPEKKDAGQHLFLVIGDRRSL